MSQELRFNKSITPASFGTRHLAYEPRAEPEPNAYEAWLETWTAFDEQVAYHLFGSKPKKP